MKNQKPTLSTLFTASLLLGGASLADVRTADATDLLNFRTLGSGSEVRADLLAGKTPNPFGITKGDDTEGKCGENKCGEGKCGDDKDKTDTEGKCGEGKCGGDKKGE